MTAQDRATLKSYFEHNDQPTAAQFADLIDSFMLVGAQFWTDIDDGALWIDADDGEPWIE